MTDPLTTNEPLNYVEALQLAHIRAHGSNLARCYIALTAERDRLKSLLGEAVDDDGYVSYGGPEDEVGHRSCCYVVSYMAHSENCWVPKARAALNGDSHT